MNAGDSLSLACGAAELFGESREFRELAVQLVPELGSLGFSPPDSGESSREVYLSSKRVSPGRTPPVQEVSDSTLNSGSRGKGSQGRSFKRVDQGRATPQSLSQAGQKTTGGNGCHECVVSASGGVRRVRLNKASPSPAGRNG